MWTKNKLDNQWIIVRRFVILILTSSAIEIYTTNYDNINVLKNIHTTNKKYKQIYFQSEV